MTDTIDTERMVLITMLKRDADSLEKVSEAVADALFAVASTAVPLTGQDGPLEAMLEGLNQALAKSLELTKALRSLSRHVEKNEISGHELAEILARKHYLDRRGYASWTLAPLVPKNCRTMGE